MHTKHFAAYFSLALIALVMIAPVATAQTPLAQLALTITTDKPGYHYRQLVKIYGNVTINDKLVSDGLVAIQFQDPLDRIRALRTVPANATPQENWAVVITSFQSTDSEGNLQTSFKKGGTIWFMVNVSNNDPFEDHAILLTITLFDYDATPFKYHWLNTTLTAGTGLSEMVRLDLNPYEGGDWVSTGTAKAYANVYTDWPANGGYPYSPEKPATFTITSSSTLADTRMDTNPQPLASGYNSYQASIRLPPNVPLGTYTLTASAYSGGLHTYTTKTFNREYELRGDIVFNRKIDIFDLVKVATSYGTQGGNSRWNPEADVVPNGIINIFDIVTVATLYGKTY